MPLSSGQRYIGLGIAALALYADSKIREDTQTPDDGTDGSDGNDGSDGSDGGDTTPDPTGPGTCGTGMVWDAEAGECVPEQPDYSTHPGVIGELGIDPAVSPPTLVDPVHTRFPKAYKETHENGTLVGTTVYMSKRVYERNGTAPEEILAKHLADAYRQHHRNYQVGFGFEPLDVPYQETGQEGRRNCWNWFGNQIKNGNIPRAKDANLLILDRKGGGLSTAARAEHGYGVTPGRYLSDPEPFERWAKAPWPSQARNTLAGLHEHLHQVGIHHPQNGKSGGMSWVDSEGRFWQTPALGNGFTNICGESTAEQPDGAPLWNYYGFNHCTVSNLKIKPL